MALPSELHQVTDDFVVASPPHSRLPRLDLGVDWTPAREEFRTSLRDAFSGPKPDSNEPVSGGDDLRVEWVRTYRPGTPLIAAAMLEILALWVIALPIWGFLPKTEASMAPIEVDMGFYVPTDLREITLAPRKQKAAHRATPAKVKSTSDAQRGADGFHPRQTILSVPVKLTHPRQTLIQPNASTQAPKILPQLPNIVEWAAPKIEKPAIEYSTSTSAPRVRAKQESEMKAPQINDETKNSAKVNLAQSPDVKLAPPAPQVSNAAIVQRRAIRETAIAAPRIDSEARRSNPINIAPVDATHIAPPAPVPSNAKISLGSRTAREAAAAPEIGSQSSGNTGDLRKLVALSANPAPPAPDARIPAGNLAANVSISPDGKRSGAPGGVENGSAGSKSNASGGNGDSLPAAISVSSANSKPANSAALRPGEISSNLSLRPMIPARMVPSTGAPRTGPANVAALPPGAPPEKLLTGDVFTLHVSTPNMTSTRGSWVLNFAQLGVAPRAAAQPNGQLAGPLPIHTVDPKYPPETMNEHIDGEVVLYAIIRKDGSIDSIQLVHSLDPRLDKAAMDALAQWQFRPGARAGEPVDIEAVIHVPFEYRQLNY